jgi:hypothetical protein
MPGRPARMEMIIVTTLRDGRDLSICAGNAAVDAFAMPDQAIVPDKITMPDQVTMPDRITTAVREVACEAVLRRQPPGQDAD